MLRLLVAILLFGLSLGSTAYGIQVKPLDHRLTHDSVFNIRLAHGPTIDPTGQRLA